MKIGKEWRNLYEDWERMWWHYAVDTLGLYFDYWQECNIFTKDKDRGSYPSLWRNSTFLHISGMKIQCSPEYRQRENSMIKRNKTNQQQLKKIDKLQLDFKFISLFTKKRNSTH